MYVVYVLKDWYLISYLVYSTYLVQAVRAFGVPGTTYHFIPI